MTNKKSVLVLLPYGMCIRQLVYNKKLWSYLTNTYSVDVMTDDVNGIDKKTFNINSVISTSGGNWFYKIINSVSYKAISYWRLAETIDFFLVNSLGENIAARWSWFKELRGKILFLGSLRYSPWIYRIFLSFVKRLSTMNYKYLLRDNKYKFVIITHVTEMSCTNLALYANQKKIPLITITLGQDNYRHGPLLYCPDLTLLWGREQASEFKKYHISLNPKLINTKYVEIGNLAHDIYNEYSKRSKENFLNEKYSLVDSFSFILIPAFPIDAGLDWQPELCDSVIEFIKQYNLKIKIIIRLLPACDIELWEDYKNNNANYVILQIPKSTLFDKRMTISNSPTKNGLSDIEDFVFTLKNVILLVNPYPSSVILDAMLFKKNSVVAMYNAKKVNDYGTHPHQKQFLAKSLKQRYNKFYNFAYSKNELFEMLLKYLVNKDTYSNDANDLFDEICRVPLNGGSGKAAVEAIENFIHE